MIVDLYTDAGIKNGVGTWATVVIRAGHDAVEDSGTLRGRFKSSTAVEACAIANALHSARKRGLIEHGDVVTVRTDNTIAVARIKGEVAAKTIRKGDPVITAATEKTLALAVAMGIELRAEWVKGHQPQSSLDPHAVHNRRCDKLCGAARKVAAPVAAKPPTRARKALDAARRLVGAPS